MAALIDSTQDHSFFKKFYDTCHALPLPIINYKLVRTEDSYLFEEKKGLDLPSLVNIFFRTTHSIDHHANEFLSMVRSKIHRIQQNVEYGHELLSCTKVCEILAKILTHVYKRRAEKFDLFRRFDLKQTQAQLDSFKTLAYKTLACSGKLLETSPLQLACINKMSSLALDCIRNGASLEEAEGHYTFLLEKAYKRKYPKELLIRLIGLGADFQFTQIPINEYLFFAFENKNIRAIKALITAGAEIKQADERGNTPLHLACDLQFKDIIEILLSRKVNPNAINKQGNTPLHISCFRLDLDTVRLLIQAKASVTTINLSGLFPFEMAAKHNPHSSASHFYDNYFTNDLQPHFNPFEKPLLLQDLATAKKIASKMTYKDFLQTLEKLSALYPESSLACVELAYLEINPAHFQKGHTKIEMKEPEEEVDLTALLGLFDQINFQNPDAPYFRNPESLRSDLSTTNPAQFRKMLQNFIRIIKNRVAFLGTPTAGSPALREFYNYMELAVKNTIVALRKNPNKDFQDSVIIEYIRASSHCGGRYYNETTKQYLRICVGHVPTFEDEIYKSLANYREILFQTGVGTGAHNVNDYNYILRRLGEQYGLPRAEMFKAYSDPYGGANLTDTEKKFKALYTPSAVVKDWIFAQIQDDYVLRNQFIDWCTANIPRGWQKEYFNPIIEHVQKMQAQSATQSEINNYLSQKGISILDQTTAPLEAIQKEKAAAYLATEVFDMDTGKLKIHSIAYMLTKLEVVESVFDLEEKEPFNLFDVGYWVNKAASAWYAFSNSLFRN